MTKITNRAELYRYMRMNNISKFYTMGSWMTINQNDLLSNPACDWVTLWSRDGSDYNVNIEKLTAVFN